MPNSPPPQYDFFEPALHEAAEASTGLTDFGDDDYREGLKRVIEAFERDLPDDTATRAHCFALTLPGLVGRLHSEWGWREQPDCLEASIRRPLVIAGIPRTGTTALHNLLSLDPRFQELESWIIPNPIVRTPREDWPGHPLYRAAVTGAQALSASSPRVAAVHGVAPDEPDECLSLMMQSYVTNQLPSLLDLPSYDAWYLVQDEVASYRRLADNLRLIGFAEPKKTWLLKNPTHLLRMESLLSVFPDARVIHTHRDPVETFGSLCSMLAAFRGDPAPGSAAARAIGPRQLRIYRQAVEHTMAVRERHAEAFHDVYQADLRADPMRVLRGIYAHFELDWSDEVERRMLEWLAERAGPTPRAKGPDPADYGLDVNEIEYEMAGYAARYGL
jgi:hypothetical protein